MPPRFDEEAHDGLLADRVGSLKPVQGLNEYEACPVRPHQDRCL